MICLSFLAGENQIQRSIQRGIKANSPTDRQKKRVSAPQRRITAHITAALLAECRPPASHPQIVNPWTSPSIVSISSILVASSVIGFRQPYSLPGLRRTNLSYLRIAIAASSHHELRSEPEVPTGDPTGELFPGDICPLYAFPIVNLALETYYVVVKEGPAPPSALRIDGCANHCVCAGKVMHGRWVPEPKSIMWSCQVSCIL